MSTPTDPAPGVPTRRPMSVGYLVTGLVFLGIAGIWALRVTDVVDTDQVPVLVPALLVLAGLVGLGAFVARSSRRGTAHDERPADDDLDDTSTYDDLYPPHEGEQR